MPERESQPRVDAVIVAYNSGRTLRDCVAPLAQMEHVHVTVVDNASPDDSLAAISDLEITAIRAPTNGGFASGCNIGLACGTAPYVLLINPDARIDGKALDALTAVLEAEPSVGLVGPRILEDDESLAYSMRRFPRHRTTFAQALFLHRLWPRASWTDELIRDPGAYERPGTPDWLSGACMLIRRAALDQIGGLDEDFFLYCEDIDLCARLTDTGYAIRFEPTATVRHEGGASRPGEELLTVLARNRVLYARKHARRGAASVEAAGVALGHLTHAAASINRPSARRGHLRALAAALQRPASPTVRH